MKDTHTHAAHSQLIPVTSINIVDVYRIYKYIVDIYKYADVMMTNVHVQSCKGHVMRLSIAPHGRERQQERE